MGRGLSPENFGISYIKMVSFYAFPVILIDTNCKPLREKTLKGTLIKRAGVRTPWTPPVSAPATRVGRSGMLNDSFISNFPQCTSERILQIRGELTKLPISAWCTSFFWNSVCAFAYTKRLDDTKWPETRRRDLLTETLSILFRVSRLSLRFETVSRPRRHIPGHL